MMLEDLGSVDLAGWLEYLKLDDEFKRYQVAQAIMMAFRKSEDS